MIAPIEMVSRPCALQMSLSRMIDPRSSLRQFVPAMHNVSYSGLWESASLPGAAFMCPPQAMAHRQHAYLRCCSATTASPAMRSTWGNSAGKLPDQFLTGESPTSASPSVSPAVPKSLSSRPLGLMRGSHSFRSLSALVWSAMGTRWVSPLATTALSFLEPMTAPRPVRPAARPLSLITAAMRVIFSPAGPMQATLVCRGPWRSRRASSVARVSLPQRSEASRSSALPLSMSRYTGFGEMPVKNTASKPANLR